MEVTVTDEGRETDKLLDSHTRQVFLRLVFSYAEGPLSVGSLVVYGV